MHDDACVLLTEPHLNAGEILPVSVPAWLQYLVHKSKVSGSDSNKDKL